MSTIGNSLRVPMFLAAPTRDGLVRLMLSNNVKKSKEHKYFDISFDGKNWVAWFLDEIDVRKVNSLKDAK